MLRIGLLGLGRHGQRYAAHLVRHEVPGARLSGFWRRDPVRAAEAAATLGVPAFSDPAALLDASDAVVIVVPASEHPALAAQAAAHGTPTLLEKPLACTAAAGERLIAAFEARDAPLMVAHTLRFDPLSVALATAAQRPSPLLGFDLEQRLEPRGLAWELDPQLAGGGVLLQTGIHGLDTLRFVTGRPVELLSTSLGHLHGHATEDQASLRLRIGRACGDLRTSKIGGSRHHRYALYFEDGGVEADYIARTLTEVRGRDRSTRAVPEIPTVCETLRAFAAWVDGSRPDCPVPPREALDALRVVDAAYGSLRPL